jgi:hypothetical protein
MSMLDSKSGGIPRPLLKAKMLVWRPGCDEFVSSVSTNLPKHRLGAGMIRSQVWGFRLGTLSISEPDPKIPFSRRTQLPGLLKGADKWLPQGFHRRANL